VKQIALLKNKENILTGIRCRILTEENSLEGPRWQVWD